MLNSKKCTELYNALYECDCRSLTVQFKNAIEGGFTVTKAY